MLQYPRPCLIRSHISHIRVCIFGGERIAEGDEFPMCVYCVGYVVCGVCKIAPYIRTALGSHVSGDDISMRKGGVEKRTLIHMLALPAQLRNSFCRSLREKNLSRTIDTSCHKNDFQYTYEMRWRWREPHRTPPRDSFVPYPSSRPRGRLPLLLPDRHPFLDYISPKGRGAEALTTPCHCDSGSVNDINRLCHE